MRRISFAVLLALAAGCGPSGDAGAPDAASSPDASMAGCNVGESATSAGCVPPGIPASACGAGFVSVPGGECVPTLPNGACASGTMAVPGDLTCRAIGPVEPPSCTGPALAAVGDTTCHPIADCGTSTWGAIPVDASTQYVDASFSGASDGSASKPWTTISAALAAAQSGAIVAIAAGSYAESLVVSKPVKLWGRCPAQTEIAGPAGSAVVTFAAGAAASELHQVALKGGTLGVVVASGASSIVLDKLWSRGGTSGGLQFADTFSLTGSVVEGAAVSGIEIDAGGKGLVEGSVVRNIVSGADKLLGDGIVPIDGGVVTVHGSVIEHTRDSGVIAFGGSATVDTCVVRDVQANEADGTEGQGLAVTVDGTFAASAVLKNSLIVRTIDSGVWVQGGTLDMDSTRVAQTSPRTSDQGGGTGLRAFDSAGGAQSTATVKGSLFEANHTFGVLSEGANVTLDGCTVRQTLPAPADAKLGYGMQVQPGAARGSSTLKGCVLEQNTHTGLGIVDASAAVTGSVIRNTLASPLGTYGRGIEVVTDANVPPSTLTVDASVLTENRDVSIAIFNSVATVTNTVMKATSPLQSPLTGGGQGIVVQTDDGAATMGALTLKQSLVTGNSEVGVAVSSALLVADGLLVSSTTKSATGMLGDGIAMDRPQDGTTLANSLVDKSDRASLSAFSGNVAVKNVRFRCDMIDIDAEQNASFGFDVSSPPRCGCVDPGTACGVLSSNLVPPGPLSHGG